MSTNNGNGLVPQDDLYRGKARQLEIRALANNWPLTPEQRAAIIAGALVDSTDDDPRVRNAARRVLLLADSINARRERTDVQEETARASNAIAAVRAMLAAQHAALESPGARSAAEEEGGGVPPLK